MRVFQICSQLLAVCVAVTLARGARNHDPIHFNPSEDDELNFTTAAPPLMSAAAAPEAAPASGLTVRAPASSSVPDIVTNAILPASYDSAKPYTPGLLDQAINTLTLNMETILDTGKDFLVFSPVSIAGALSLIMLGSSGQTLKELAALLGVNAGERYDEDGTDSIHRQIAEYFQRFGTDTIGGTVRFASGVFVQNTLPVSTKYMSNVQRFYGSEVLGVDFGHKGMLKSMEEINGWAANRTEGLLKRVLSNPLPTDTMAVFINIIYFEGEWVHPFCTKCLQERVFHVKDGEEVKVPMMLNTAPAFHHEDKEKGYKILGLPYKNSDLVMFFLVPKKDPKEFLAGVQVPDLVNMINNATEKDTIYLVPKMKLESTLDLVDPLKKMGVQTMFSPTADLSGIAHGIWVDSVLQKVDIEINETGTRAVVSTMIATTRDGHRPVVKIDKPFIFMAYHRKLRSITFWGTVYKPTPHTNISR